MDKSRASHYKEKNGNIAYTHGKWVCRSCGYGGDDEHRGFTRHKHKRYCDKCGKKNPK